MVQSIVIYCRGRWMREEEGSEDTSAGSVGSEQKDVRGRTKEWSEYQTIPQLSLLLRGEMMSEERSKWSSRRLDLVLQVVDRYVMSCCRG